MINVTLTQLQADIAPMLKGTSTRQIKDFYGTAGKAMNRMLGRIDPQETIRTATLASAFWASVQDYVAASDYKRMIDIRPQVARQRGPGNSNFSETSPRQFLEDLSPNSFSIRWNNMVRTLRAQVLPDGNCVVLDSFDGPSANGLWVASTDANTIYTEPLNYVEGNGAMGFSLSGATGVGTLVNSTVPAALDLSSYLNEDASFIYLWIPVGNSSRITNLQVSRGDSASAYRTVTVTTKADGTPFTDGWNQLLVSWQIGINTNSPTNTSNQYRKIIVNYTTGAAIAGLLLDAWSNDLGKLYEMEYYSEYGFRTASGTWIVTPTASTDLVNVGPLSYEILKTEMMVDITQEIRTGNVRATELADWRLMLNGQPQSRYVKDPPYHGLYQDYMRQFPSSAIVTRTQYYKFDV